MIYYAQILRDTRPRQRPPARSQTRKDDKMKKNTKNAAAKKRAKKNTKKPAAPKE